MNAPTRKAVLATVVVLIILRCLCGDSSYAVAQPPLHRTLLLHHYILTCQAAYAALLSHVVFLQLLCLNYKTRDRALGPSAGRIKLPRRSLSIYQTVPRETYWYDIGQLVHWAEHECISWLHTHCFTGCADLTTHQLLGQTLYEPHTFKNPMYKGTFGMRKAQACGSPKQFLALSSL